MYPQSKANLDLCLLLATVNGLINLGLHDNSLLHLNSISLAISFSTNSEF